MRLSPIHHAVRRTRNAERIPIDNAVWNWILTTNRRYDCASLRSRGCTAVLELLATPARAIIVAGRSWAPGEVSGAPPRDRAGGYQCPRDLRVRPVLYLRLPSSGVFHKTPRSLRLWASSARELPQAVYRIPTSPFWILFPSIEFQLIGFPSVPQSGWSAGVLDTRTRATGQPTLAGLDLTSDE